MHIDVTEIVNHDDTYAPVIGSVYYLGSNASILTWNNALELALTIHPLTDDEQLQNAKDYFRSLGFSESVYNYNEQQLNALLIQQVKSEQEHIDDYMEDNDIYHYDDMTEGHWEECFSVQGGNLTYNPDDSTWQYYLEN